MFQVASKSKGVQIAGQGQPARAQSRSTCRLIAMLTWDRRFEIEPWFHLRA